MKVTGSYPTLVRGVSQQAPQDRRPGQQTEQINLLPDPVLGLARRWGSIYQNEQLLGAWSAVWPMDYYNFRRYEYSAQGVDYVLLYRTTATPVGSNIPPLILYDKTNKGFIPYGGWKDDQHTNAWAPAYFAALATNGISAVTAVGKYLVMAVNEYPSTHVSADEHALSSSQAAVWVRGGAYARKFTVTLKPVGSSIGTTIEYTTPTASYPGTLDTASVPLEVLDHAGGTTAHTSSIHTQEVPASVTPPSLSAVYCIEIPYYDLTPSGMTVRRGATVLSNVYPAAVAPGTDQYSWNPANPQFAFLPFRVEYEDAGTYLTASYTTVKTMANPDYTKQVNDITSAYNQAVTQWIGTAGAAVQPEAIAEQLRLLAVAAGYSVARNGSTLTFGAVSFCEASDSGDGSLLSVAYNAVTDTTELTPYHYYNKVVTVRPKGSAEAYYMQARLADGTKAAGATVGPVTWYESRKISRRLSNVLLTATVQGGQLGVYSADYSGLNPTNGVLPPRLNENTVGDDDTSPMPTFVGNAIDYLGLFQDRLVVGTQATLTFSATGDYLNFFRSTVLTLPGNDAFEMVPPGNADDTIKHSVLYDRNLVLFGDKYQYVVSGRVPITPTSANMQVMSAHVGAGDIPPVASGGVIFYAKRGEDNTSLWQLVPGDSADNPRSFSASSQLDDYIDPTSLELTPVAKPQMLLVRTKESGSKLFAFSYLDDQEGRKQDAWHTLQYGDSLGGLLAASPYKDGALLFHLRVAYDQVYVVCDYQQMTGTLGSKPYLDSQRPYAHLSPSVGSMRLSTAQASAAYTDAVPHAWLGAALGSSQLSTYVSTFTNASLMAGYDYPAAVTLTNPFVRDSSDKAISTGRLTVTKLVLSLSDTAGYYTTVDDTTTHYTGVFVDAEETSLGLVTPVDRRVTVPIGKETRAYTFTLSADRWFPMTLSGVGYVGQYFNRATRI